jgi:hypothetical protein
VSNGVTLPRGPSPTGANRIHGLPRGTTQTILYNGPQVIAPMRNTVPFGVKPEGPVKIHGLPRGQKQVILYGGKG